MIQISIKVMITFVMTWWIINEYENWEFGIWSKRISTSCWFYSFTSPVCMTMYSDSFEDNFLCVQINVKSNKNVTLDVSYILDLTHESECTYWRSGKTCQMSGKITKYFCYWLYMNSNKKIIMTNKTITIKKYVQFSVADRIELQIAKINLFFFLINKFCRSLRQLRRSSCFLCCLGLVDFQVLYQAEFSRMHCVEIIKIVHLIVFVTLVSASFKFANMKQYICFSCWQF